MMIVGGVWSERVAATAGFTEACDGLSVVEMDVAHTLADTFVRNVLLLGCDMLYKPSLSLQAQNLPFLLPTGLPSWQRDWAGPIMLIVLFLVSHFNFLFRVVD